MAPVENKKIHHDQLNRDFETTAPPADKTTTKSAARQKPISESSARPDPTAVGLADRVDGSKSKSVVFAKQRQQQAHYEETKRLLSAHPEQADAEIAKRLNGPFSNNDRDIVRMAVAARGNVGWKKLADAEQAIRALKGFSSAEKAEIRANMQAGCKFEEAITETRNLRPQAQPKPALDRASTAAALHAQAIKNKRLDARVLDKLGGKVHALLYAMPQVNRALEVGVGFGAATVTLAKISNLPLSIAASRSLKPIGENFGAAGDSMELAMGGALTKRLDQANQTAVKFFNASSGFTDAQNRFERAARDGDYDGMLREKKQMHAYASAMLREYESLKNQAPAIKKWTETFTKTSVSAAFAVAQLALFEAPEIENVKGLVRELGLEIAKDQIAEKAAEKAGHAVAE